MIKMNCTPMTSTTNKIFLKRLRLLKRADLYGDAADNRNKTCHKLIIHRQYQCVKVYIPHDKNGSITDTKKQCAM